MAKRKVKAKKITKILICVILIVAILAGGSFFYIYNFSKKKPEPQVEEKKEEVKKVEVLKSPVKDNIGIVRYFYDKDDESEKQEQSLILFEGVYRANLGIDYACQNEVFDVCASISGKVTSLKNDPILGWVVSISQDDIVVTYESLSEVNVKLNDNVKQGDKIGKCGSNLYEADLKNHVHFMLEKNDIVLNPEKYLNKEISTIK